MVSGICRLIDKNKDSVSMINLLDKILHDPKHFTKNEFVKQYIKGKSGFEKDTMEAVAMASFEKNFSKTGKYIDVSVVCADIGRVVSSTAEIKRFRNKRVAHKDKNDKLVFNLDFRDLDEAIDVIEKIVLKYNLLINQSGLDNLLPTVQYDWKKIFRIPWINNN